jgi:hypothetical protein
MSCPIPRPSIIYHNKLTFCDEKLSAPHPTPKLEGYSLLAVHDFLFSIPVFAVTLHIWRMSPPSTS